MTNIKGLLHTEGTSYVADYTWYTYRYLLSNGDTIDVSAVQDGSWLREEVLKIVNKVDKVPERGNLAITIVGTATLADPVVEKPVKKVAAKKTAAKKVS